MCIRDRSGGQSRGVRYGATAAQRGRPRQARAPRQTQEGPYYYPSESSARTWQATTRGGGGAQFASRGGPRSINPSTATRSTTPATTSRRAAAARPVSRPTATARVSGGSIFSETPRGGVTRGTPRDITATRAGGRSSEGRGRGGDIQDRGGDGGAQRLQRTTTAAAAVAARGGPREATATTATSSSGGGRGGRKNAASGRLTDAESTTATTSTTTPPDDSEKRPSTTRSAETIIKRALEDQSDRIDDLRGRVDEALRDDALMGGVFGAEYYDPAIGLTFAGAGALGLGYYAGFNDGYYDPGFFNRGIGGFGVGFGAQGTVFPDSCCASGLASTAAYCGVWTGGFNMPCCVNGGPYLCDQAALLSQNTLDRSYPEPCCSNGYAVRGDFCSGRFDEQGQFPCCLDGAEYTCELNARGQGGEETTGSTSISGAPGAGDLSLIHI